MKYFLLFILLLFLAGCSSTQVVQQTTEPVQQIVPVSEGEITPVSSLANNTNATIPSAPASKVSEEKKIVQNIPTKGTGKENLKLEHVLVTPLNPLPDETVDISFDITNTVMIPVSDISYVLQILKDNVTYKEEKDVIANISGNESLSFKKSFVFEKGKYKVILLVDPENELSELKETDNDKTILITVLTEAEKEFLKNSTKKNTSSSSKKEKNTSSSSSSQNTDTKPMNTGKCKDTDGKNYNTVGTCNDEMQVLTDFCLGENTLWEWYCDAAEDRCVYEEEDPCVCKQGACV